MIYLLDEINLLTQLNSLGKIKSKIINIDTGELILDRLEVASQTKELIHTQWLRGIGKTHGLVKFAKKYGYIIFHPNATQIIEEEGYKYIYGWYEVHNAKRETDIRNVVIDEGFSDSQIMTIKEHGFKIITGFYTCSKIKDERPFSEKVLETLVGEIEELTPKLEKLRKSEDYGTYRNLINAYKEILGLIQNHIQNYDIK